MNTVKVSIIVPIYNVEQYIRRCLESVAEQSYKNIEVIMVDDGSTDNSGNIAQEYVDKYPFFRLVKQTNLGLGGARNTGIKYATGDYIAMPDSDDWLHKDYIKILVEEALKHNADVVECNGIQIWENGATKKRRSHISTIKIVNNKEQYLKTFSYVVWNKLFKKELIDNLPFTEHMTKQDYAWTPIIISKAYKIVQIPNVLYYYLWRGNSATNVKKINHDLLKAQNILESNDEFSKKFPDVLQYYYVRNIMNDFLWFLSLNYSKKIEVQKVLYHVKEKYPNINKDLYMLGRIKSVWAREILCGHYMIAFIISIIYQNYRILGRSVLNLYRAIANFANYNYCN